MKFLRPSSAALAVLAFGLLSTTASASVMGVLDIANCANGGVTVSANTITWLPAGTTAGYGCVVTGGATNVTFSGGTLGGGVTGDIKNLTLSPPTPGTNFLAFPSATSPTLAFDLLSFGPGVANTTCTNTFDPNQPSCSVTAGSPFVLTPSSTGTFVGLSATIQAKDPTPNTIFSGGFTTQISNQTPFQIQQTILAGGSVNSTHSADFRVKAVVPEPGTTSMALLGGLFIGVATLRRKIRS